MNCLNSIANQSFYEKDMELISEGARVLAQFEQFYVEHNHAARIMDKLIEEAGKGQFSMSLTKGTLCRTDRLNILRTFDLENCPVKTDCKIGNDQIKLLPENIFGYYIPFYILESGFTGVKGYLKRPEEGARSTLFVRESAGGYYFSYEVFLAYKIKELILKDGGDFYVSSSQGILISWGKREFKAKGSSKKWVKSNKKFMRVLNVVAMAISVFCLGGLVGLALTLIV